MFMTILFSTVSNILLVSLFHFLPRRKMYGVPLKVELQFLKNGILLGIAAVTCSYLSIHFQILPEKESILLTLGLLAAWGFMQLTPSTLRPSQIASAVLILTALDSAYPALAGAKFVFVGLLCFITPFVILFAIYRNRRQRKKSQQRAKDYEERRRQLAKQALEDIKKRWSSIGTLVNHDELKQKFEIDHKLQFLKPGYPYNLRVIEGDLHIEGDLDLETEDIPYSHGLLVTGNLNVTGCILNTSSDTGAFLLCFGDLKAHAVIGGGSEIVIEGNAFVEELVLGHYNDGILAFKKDLSCPLVISDDHDLTIRGKLHGKRVDSSTCQGALWEGHLVEEISIPNDPDEDRTDIGFEWKEVLLPRLKSKMPVVKKSVEL